MFGRARVGHSCRFTALWVSGGGESGARLILYAGEPQSTPVVMQGPFVGEARADISRLNEEYQQGRFPHMSELAHH